MRAGDPKIDPELLRQLDEAETTHNALEAVFVLGPEDGSAPSPDQVESMVRQLVDRAQQTCGATFEDVNVFRHLASFVARAEPHLIRHLLEQPEITSATANRDAGR